MKILLLVDIPKLTSKLDGVRFAASLAEHIVDTFNDDNSIKSVMTSVYPHSDKERGTS